MLVQRGTGVRLHTDIVRRFIKDEADFMIPEPFSAADIQCLEVRSAPAFHRMPVSQLCLGSREPVVLGCDRHGGIP